MNNKKINKETICVVRGTFAGIYGWGEGFQEGKKEKWDEYWSNFKDTTFAKLMPAKFQNASDELIIGGASIYMHPMGFSTVMRSSGCICPRGNDDELEDRFGTELDELKKICDEVAKNCGGTYTQVAEMHKIYNSEFREWK